jgi:hypothetical protein
MGLCVHAMGPPSTTHTFLFIGGHLDLVCAYMWVTTSAVISEPNPYNLNTPIPLYPYTLHSLNAHYPNNPVPREIVCVFPSPQLNGAWNRVQGAIGYRGIGV